MSLLIIKGEKYGVITNCFVPINRARRGREMWGQLIGIIALPLNYKVCPATRAFFQLLQNAEPATKVLFAIQAKINQISFAPFSNPSQECYYNSINPLVKGLPDIFTDLYMGGPTYSQAQNIQGPPVSALPLSPQFNSLNYTITVYSYYRL